MHRSQSRERFRGAGDPRSTAGCDPSSYEPMKVEGYVQHMNYIKPSRVELGSNTLCGAQTESNSNSFDFKNSSKKETRTPIRAATAEEMSTERQIKRTSPSVIARLMGLDSLPSPQFLKPRNEMISYSRKVSSKELQKPTKHDDCSLKKRSDELQECKDVFEVIQGQQVENHKKQGIRNPMPSLKHNETDMAFIRQSFINAKRLSTDEKLQRSQEFDDALEVLESNKDLFLKLLQEPHSLFSENLQHRTHSSPYQPAKHAMIRKSSRESLRGSDSQSQRQHVTEPNGLPFRAHICSLTEKYSDSIYGGKEVEDIIPPTHIVILKPSIKKVQKAERTVQSVISLENGKHGVINRRELMKEGVADVFQEERDRQNLHALGNMRLRTKHTTELAKNVTQQMRNSTVAQRKAAAPKYSNYVQDSDLWPITSIAGAINPHTSYRSYDNINEYCKGLRPLESCTVESSVNMEAQKHLSEQRRLTRHLHELGISMRASNTLSEMLALSDKEISKKGRHTLVKKACSSGISSKDGLKDGFSRNLSRSKSTPASSLVYGNSQHNSRNGVISNRYRDNPNKSKPHSDGEENGPTLREIHVRSEEFKHGSNVVSLTEEAHAHTTCNLSDIRSPDIVDIFSVPCCNIPEPSFSVNCKGLEEVRKVTCSGINGQHIECGHCEVLSKQKSSDNYGDVLLPFNGSKTAVVSPICSKEADQPSPVSVLDLPSKDDKSSPSCFKKISDDLQELRRQLQILKFDNEEIEAFISSDEDAAESFSQLGDVQKSFRDEDDRDYSYLIDMLIESEILKLDSSGLYSECQLTEFPVGLNVFNQLEKKYESVESWSRPGRKLLFDLVNSTVADIAAMPYMNMRSQLVSPRLFRQSKMAYEGLVEEIWQAVVKRRKEVGNYSEEDLIGLKWFGFANTDLEVVCRELENMVSESLMDELVQELVYM